MADQDYTFRKTENRCARCDDHEFQVEEDLYSVILVEESELLRRDYCVDCFPERGIPEHDEFAFWRTRMPSDGKPRRVIDFNTLRELFFQMVDRNRPEHRKLCYLLGLVLLRKRSIRLKEFVTEGGTDYLVVTTRLREEPLKLEAPELLTEEFDALRDQLRCLLDVDEESGLDLDAALAAGPAEPEPAEAPAPDPEEPASPPPIRLVGDDEPEVEARN